MDKSFNDQELSDIMKEIEALEDDFQNEGGSKIEASPVMEELAQMDEEDSVPVAKEAPVVKMASVGGPKPYKKAASNSQTQMSFKVSGELNLELEFDVGGKIVNLVVNEQGLSIEMEGGMTFNVPLKKAA